MSNVIVIGAGASGMMAAIAAAQLGHHVMLLEKNEKPGKKIYITGKGRCNCTNACDTEQFFRNVVSNPKFLYSSLHQFDQAAVRDFLEEYGCPVKVERGERVFPVSDHASDVTAALVRALKANYAELRLGCEVREVLYRRASAEEQASWEGKQKPEQAVSGVRLSTGEELMADAVILACGGISYPSTGSTGDGYRFAEAVGHQMVEAKPALVPLEICEPWCKELMGLSLKNVEATLEAADGHVIYREFGEMLFTHFGVSGPLIISASSYLQKEQAQKGAMLYLDLKPALDLETLDKRLLREFDTYQQKAFHNALDHLFPKKLIPVMVKLSGIDPEKKAGTLLREERRSFAQLIKQLPLTVSGIRGFQEAIVTQGGISVSEVNPSTMESRLCHGLYLVGEMLDVDALTGGFNLQIAWSTGHLAGSSIPW
ncbi:MAG: NAD(P)/FAD-dependent oxidoreductase [Lachnospiraceae bacterium]|nr:NAD(P)/FAD-dependent oxidoreductase [Lachnospiraceae bacterium]